MYALTNVNKLNLIVKCCHIFCKIIRLCLGDSLGKAERYTMPMIERISRSLGLPHFNE